MLQTEYETKLNRVSLHIYVPGHYEEDYQMPMLRQNRIRGVLGVEGCELEGKSRYTYEVSGLVSLKSLHEKSWIRKREIQGVVAAILEVTETLQKYMLNPDCLILKPEYIFQKEAQWFFCYLPGVENNLSESFHELTEYFVKTLDYEDTEGIFLAYELHKATLQEHYDLKQIMKEYEMHEEERSRAAEEEKEGQENYGNIFCLTEEEEEYETEEYKKEQADSASAEYELSSRADIIREESGWWSPRRKAEKHARRKRWGNWNDLILETDGQEEQAAL